jgi:transposase-like protein
MMAAAIGTIFAQPTGAEVTDQVDKVAAMLQPKFPAVATMLLDAREDLTAFAGFPPAHWTKIVSRTAMAYTASGCGKASCSKLPLVGCSERALMLSAHHRPRRW